jgi:hypothetical protein
MGELMALFQPGMPKTPGSGRARGVKNKLSHAFLTALAEDFEQHGTDAIRICRVERPHEYLRVIAHLMPKELEVSIGPLQEISDDELTGFIEHAQRQIAGRVERIESRTSEEKDGGQAPILLSVPKAT